MVTQQHVSDTIGAAAVSKAEDCSSGCRAAVCHQVAACQAQPAGVWSVIGLARKPLWAVWEVIPTHA